MKKLKNIRRKTLYANFLCDSYSSSLFSDLFGIINFVKFI